ncbi:MAG: hypothetical protein MZV70_62360 [Desulfobacterales bacterium]|nr:hypothetical protein [Desulfobacterales bacterium]
MRDRLKPPEAAPAKSLPSVSVAAATSGSISRTIELDGTVEAARIARMSSPAEGPYRTAAPSVREGDHVKKASKSSASAGTRRSTPILAAAQADLTREKGELDRVKNWLKTGPSPETSWKSPGPDTKTSRRSWPGLRRAARTM